MRNELSGYYYQRCIRFCLFGNMRAEACMHWPFGMMMAFGSRPFLLPVSRTKLDIVRQGVSTGGQLRSGKEGRNDLYSELFNRNGWFPPAHRPGRIRYDYTWKQESINRQESRGRRIPGFQLCWRRMYVIYLSGVKRGNSLTDTYDIYGRRRKPAAAAVFF